MMPSRTYRHSRPRGLADPAGDENEEIVNIEVVIQYPTGHEDLAQELLDLLTAP